MKLFEKWKDQLLMAYHILRYHWTVTMQAALSAISSRPWTRRKSWPGLTVFISSLNTLWPLKLTLFSLEKWSPYPGGQFVFGENASTDGSAEFLKQFSQTHRAQIISANGPRPHGQWLDEMFRQSTTPYTAFIDSDILFFPRGLLQSAIEYLEKHPDCWMLAADRRPASPYPGDPEIHCPEALSTWLFVVRTGLRDRIQATYLGQDGQERGPSGKVLRHYECGALVLEAMQKANLRYDIMPWDLRVNFFHFGNLSWFNKVTDSTNRFVKMKVYQMRDIERRARKLESRLTPVRPLV